MTEDKEFNQLLRKTKYEAEARQIFCYKYYSLLKKHIFSKYGKFSDWEDIVHDVINKLFETDWTNYPYIKRPVSWLYTVADNYAKDTLKKANRIYELSDNIYTNFNIDTLDIRSDVRDAMRHLNVEEQYIIYAHYWLRKELYTIAKEINKTYVSVRVAIFRARKILKKYL